MAAGGGRLGEAGGQQKGEEEVQLAWDLACSAWSHCRLGLGGKNCQGRVDSNLSTSVFGLCILRAKLSLSCVMVSLMTEWLLPD